MKLKPTDSVLVQRTLQIARTMTKKKVPKKPLTVAMMSSMVKSYQTIVKPKYEDTRDIFLILLMMAAFLRESEAVALKANDVWVDKVTVNGKERKVLMVYVEKAKNDQERMGNVVMVGDSVGSELCPVSWFRKYVVVRTRLAEYFFHTKKDKKLSKTTPAGRMKKWVAQIGVNADEYSSHSARIGGTTAASQDGVATILLKRHGNWKSDVVYDYIRDSVEDKLSVTSFLGSST
jgi:site-specific recombinase XerD